MMHLMIILKEKLDQKMCKYFHLQASLCCAVSIYTKVLFFYLGIRAPQEETMLLHSLPV